ncbi:hypothetical protein [Pararhizobium sp. YC-54]|uniref:hypothetical protein n=1 Tax=Pararhizobium sp. YC-54 TaxID=2986920 RepID=UPI00299DEA60|nr:hypothetical protein [Pararhizobium sp. YC-54]
MQKKANDAHEDADGRREFLKSCGRFAAVTPPAITMLLSTSLTSNAIAKSGGGGGGKTKGNNGFGNGGGDGVPGNSGKTDFNR